MRPRQAAQQLVRKLRDRLERPDASPRAPQLRADDVFLASFPRSGNTWLRAVIARLLYPPERFVGLRDLNQLVPDIHVRIPVAARYSKPRVIKTHMPFAQRHEAHRPELYRRVIYAVRHPVPALHSYYHYALAHSAHGPTRPTLSEFVERVLSYDDSFGSWQQHVLSWHAAAKDREVLFVRYEDMERDLAAETLRVARFLSVEGIDSERAGEIAALSSRTQMVELDRARPLTRAGFEFVRRSNDDRADVPAFDPALRALVIERCKEGMQCFGYPLE